VQIGFAHRGLQPQQEAIVVMRGVVDTVRVGEERVIERTLLNEMIPIAAGPRQPAHLRPENNADVIPIHFQEDLMEPRTMFGRPPGGRLIVVDDQDTLGWPTQFDRIPAQVVLQGGGFAMMEDLLRAGLPHIDDGPSLEVVRLDLGRT
jgi:hypothetical protein